MARSERLGEIILDLGYAGSAQVSAALERQAHWRRGLDFPSLAWRLGRVMCKLGWCTPEHVAKAVAHQAELPYVRLRTLQVNPNAIAVLPKTLAVAHSAIPLGVSAGRLAIASCELPDPLALEELSYASGQRVSIAIASEEEVRDALRDHYGHQSPPDRMGYLVSAATQLLVLALAKSTGQVTLLLRRRHAELSGTWDEAEHTHHLALTGRLQNRVLSALDLLESRKAARVPAQDSLISVTCGGRKMLITCQALAERPGEATLTLERIF